MTIHYRIVDLGDLENPRYIERCVEWMAERYRIHLKKDVEQLPPPWTTQRGFDIRYCNVKREMDRESRALIASTCNNPDLTLEEKMILRQYMISEWVGFQLANVELIRQKYSGSDFSFTSQASHMAKLIQLKKDYEQRGFHLQRLYCRRKKHEDGRYVSTFSTLME